MMHMTGCIAADTEVWPAFVGMCLGEIAIFTLTFMKWYQERLASTRISVRTQALLRGLQYCLVPGATRSNLLTVMYHDGALAYLLVKAVWIANLLLTVLAPMELSTSLMMPLRVMHSTVCTRVLLNIRKFVAVRRRGGTSLEQSRAWDLAAQSCPFPEEDRYLRNHEDQ
ncbi:hypothetical protein BD309DRAFT_591288 [Dichomitus squalens]|nr:hypothetical protein BD309DRAFT_591288 [Dichomitus squalens]